MLQWPASHYMLRNIRQGEDASVDSFLKRRPPFVEDVTLYREQLRALGAFPERVGAGWIFEAGRLENLVKGYYERSAPHIYEGARSDLEGGYFLTNEQGYYSAIGAIKGRGGAYLGAGQMLSYTYAAWQGATHAYSIDINTRVSMAAIPLYGILLAISADRFELLSLLYGKPIPKTEEWVKLIDEPTDFLVKRLKGLKRDIAFEMAIGNAVKIAMHKYYEESENAGHVMEYLKSFREAIESDNHSPNVHPLSILRAKDAKGRGGALSSEAQLRRERDIFIDGRITGVASPMEGRGIAAVAADMAKRDIALGVLNISNVEDWLFEDYEQARHGGGKFDPEATARSIAAFYRNILGLPALADALLISAKGCWPTSVDGLRRYVANSIPPDAGHDEAARSADLLYSLRREETRARRHPLKNKPRLLEEYGGFGPAFRQIFAVLREGWRGSPLPRAEAESALNDGSHYFRNTLTDWERGAVLRVLEDAGMIARGEG